MKPKTLTIATLIVTAISAVNPGHGADDAKACDRQLVMRIDSAMVTAEPDGATISAFGVAESAGWKGATLLQAHRAGDTATVDFVACRPEVSAQVLTPIQTRTKIALDAGIGQIVIRTKTNAMTVTISR